MGVPGTGEFSIGRGSKIQTKSRFRDLAWLTCCRRSSPPLSVWGDTAPDTNGSLGGRITDAELEQVDLILLDIKSCDEEGHRRLTGAEVGPVLEFARRLASLRKPVWVRFVLVPGLTSDGESVGRIAHFAASLGNLARVDVLPFHQMGRFKWKELKLDYKLADVQPPAPGAVARAGAQFRAEGLETH